MPAWARISCEPGWSSTSFSSPAAIGGRPRPAWMRIGTPRSAASANTGTSRSSLSRNFCARGWSLIPRAPRSRQRRASSIGPSSRSSRTNGTSRPSELAANSSVRSFPAGSRMPVGLVEAEHVRARHAIAVHPADELVVDADHPVDVVPEMRVRVEDVELGRQAGAYALVPLRRDLPCPFERIHAPNLPRRCRLRANSAKDTFGATLRISLHFPRIGGSMKRIHLLVLLSVLALPSPPPRPAAAAQAVSSSPSSTPRAATPAPRTPTTTSSSSTGARAPSPSTAGRSSTHPLPARAGGRLR